MPVGRRIWHDERIDPHEMLRLRDMLDVAGVAYEKHDGYLDYCGAPSWRTFSTDFEAGEDGCVAGFSCVLHAYSYGGDAGCLELWAAGMPEPDGWLSADNVMDRLRECGIA